MRKIGVALFGLGLLIGCGAEDEGVLTDDERQRLENIAERLDKEVIFPADVESDATNQLETVPSGNDLD